MTDLMSCPFCGSPPVFPESKEVYGTCYDAGCEDCGLPTISIQIIDCFDYGESPNRQDVHNSWDEVNSQYGVQYVDVARNEAVNMWNRRAFSHISK